MSLEILSKYILVLIIGIIIGSASSYLYFRLNVQRIVLDIVRTGQVAIETGVPVGYVPNNIEIENTKTKNLSGLVSSFSGDNLILKVEAVPSISDERTVSVVINKNTKFFVMKQKDEGVFLKELSDYEKSGKTSSSSPLPYTKNEITRDKIVVGDMVTITLNEETLITAKSFTAESVNLIPKVK